MDTIIKHVVICNMRGMHARAASKFVRLAGQFKAEITVAKVGDVDSDPASGTSILGLMSLAAEPGTRLELAAKGADACEAITALEALIMDKFGEGE